MRGHMGFIVLPETLGVANALLRICSTGPSSQNFCEVPLDPVGRDAKHSACIREKEQASKTNPTAEQKPWGRCDVFVLHYSRTDSLEVFGVSCGHSTGHSMPQVIQLRSRRMFRWLCWQDILSAVVCVFQTLCREVYIVSCVSSVRPLQGTVTDCEHHWVECSIYFFALLQQGVDFTRPNALGN